MLSPTARRRCGQWRILAFVDEPETGWSPGDQILVELPDGQVVRCRIVTITPEGTVQVVPEHQVIIG